MRKCPQGRPSQPALIRASIAKKEEAKKDISVLRAPFPCSQCAHCNLQACIWNITRLLRFLIVVYPLLGAPSRLVALVLVCAVGYWHIEIAATLLRQNSGRERRLLLEAIRVVSVGRLGGTLLRLTQPTTSKQQSLSSLSLEDDDDDT